MKQISGSDKKLLEYYLKALQICREDRRDPEEEFDIYFMFEQVLRILVESN